MFAKFYCYKNWCFYITYEGLKRFTPPMVQIGHAVFTLPMRDWNLFFLHFYLPDYLVFTLPMRDWNEKNICTYPEDKIVFTLPMRDWNAEKNDNVPSWAQFLHYLWGIETYLLLNLWHIVYRCFYITYEGLKLC